MAHHFSKSRVSKKNSAHKIYRTVVVTLMVCRHCQESLCLWRLYESDIIGEVDSSNSCLSTIMVDGVDDSHRQMRRKCYRIFIVLHYGYLGRGNRKRIPRCVMNGIRSYYPDSNENYIGFMPT